jgi:signal transduction histidine kinase
MQPTGGLIAGSFATMRTLGSDSAAIAKALEGIPDDLTTPVPKPTTTELAVLADGLREMTRRLGEANAREAALRARLEHESRLAGLGRVVAGVSHEIRNPLAGLKLRLDAMFRRGLEERNARDVGHALAEVDRLDRVVTSFLHVSKKSGEGPPSLATPVALDELVHERIDALRPFAARRAISFDTELPKVTATIHRDAIARMFDNLLRNAIEASPEDGVITVRFQAAVEGFQIKIEDCGPGVDEEHRGRLFEPFFTSKPDGTGLGLSLARAAMEASHGSLFYERTGNVTRFIAQFSHESVTQIS